MTCNETGKWDFGTFHCNGKLVRHLPASSVDLGINNLDLMSVDNRKTSRMKPQFLTCDFSAIFVWIFMQQNPLVMIFLFLIKYPYLILTSAYALTGANNTTKREYFKINILVGTTMYTHDCTCTSTGRTPLSLTSILVVREQTWFTLLYLFGKIERRWLKVKLSPRDRKLLQDVTILDQNGTPITFVGHAEIKRRVMMSG